MGPLELLYGWQALLCAFAANGVTQFVKTVLDLVIGKDERRSIRWLNRLMLPATPIILGAIYAMLVPWLPEPMTEYLAAHNIQGVSELIGRAAWGAACGQFAAFLFDRVKETLRATRGSSTPPGPYSNT
jgi:hypothetical protein